jgi:hypothetical protein
MALLICDVILVVHSLQQSRIISQIADREASIVPSKGEPVPRLEGTDSVTGKRLELTTSTAPTFALFIYRESCHYCQANWINWERLLGDRAGKYWKYA